MTRAPAHSCPFADRDHPNLEGGASRGSWPHPATCTPHAPPRGGARAAKISAGGGAAADTRARTLRGSREASSWAPGWARAAGGAALAERGRGGPERGAGRSARPSSQLSLVPPLSASLRGAPARGPERPRWPRSHRPPPRTALPTVPPTPASPRASGKCGPALAAAHGGPGPRGPSSAAAASPLPPGAAAETPGEV